MPPHASEPARLNELHDALNEMSAMHFIIFAGPAPSFGGSDSGNATAVMSPVVRRALKALLVGSITRLRALRLSWFGAESRTAAAVVASTTAFAAALAREHAISFSADLTLDGSAHTADDVFALIASGLGDVRIVVDVRPGVASESVLRAAELVRALSSCDAGVRFDVRLVTGEASCAAADRIAASVASDPRFVFRFEVRTPGEVWANCTSTTAIAPGAAVCHAGKRNTLAIGPTGVLHKCTRALDEPMNAVGRLTEAGELEFDADRFALWTGLDYRTDPVCGGCNYAASCMGSACPLARVRGGERRCPEAKRDVARSLRDIYELA